MSRLYGNRWSAICAYLDSSTLKQLRLVSSEFCEDIYCEDISNRLSINLVCSNQLIKARSYFAKMSKRIKGCEVDFDFIYSKGTLSISEMNPNMNANDEFSKSDFEDESGLGWDRDSLDNSSDEGNDLYSSYPSTMTVSTAATTYSSRSQGVREREYNVSYIPRYINTARNYPGLKRLEIESAAKKLYLTNDIKFPETLEVLNMTRFYLTCLDLKGLKRLTQVSMSQIHYIDPPGNGTIKWPLRLKQLSLRACRFKSIHLESIEHVDELRMTYRWPENPLEGHLPKRVSTLIIRTRDDLDGFAMEDIDLSVGEMRYQHVV